VIFSIEFYGLLGPVQIFCSHWRTPTKAYDYKDDEKEMGASCFTRRIRTTPVPKGFKLPHDQQKYDGSQEPQSWLSDYLQAVRILGGSKETTMQSLQLHLTGATRSWLSKLKRETIGRETINTHIYKEKNKTSLFHIIILARVSPSPQELRDLLTHRG
jgi:hypothetical protein